VAVRRILSSGALVIAVTVLGLGLAGNHEGILYLMRADDALDRAPECIRSAADVCGETHVRLGLAIGEVARVNACLLIAFAFIAVASALDPSQTRAWKIAIVFCAIAWAAFGVLRSVP